MKITVQDVIDTMTADATLPENTVDGLLTGDAEREVTGIATAFMPTLRVIERAAEWGANLVVAHEGLFFSHRRADEMREGNAVLAEKERRIRNASMAVYRCHDYWHRVRPDGVTEGLVQALGWGVYVRERRPAATIVDIPPQTVREIADSIKGALGAAFLRASGDPTAVCRRVGVLAGHRGGGRNVIPLFETERLDLVIYGEGPEWETPEYVRDALYLGSRRALLVLGHAESEEPGMAALAERLRKLFPHVPVRHEKEEPLFSLL